MGFYLPWLGPYTVVGKINEVNFTICCKKNKKKNQIVHYDRLKPFKARSKNDDQPLHRSTRIVERLPFQRYDVDHLPSSDDKDDAVLQRNRRVVWDDYPIGGDIQEIFADKPPSIAAMAEINVGEEQQLAKSS